MNERIEELAKQAGLEGNNGHYEYDWFDPKKFAELIVKETTNVIIKGHKGHMNPALAYDSVKQHFGVEE